MRIAKGVKMNKGWVKLHRKLLDNPIIRDDNAYKMFTILLMLVDKKSGSYTCGRFQLSKITEINPNTVYATLKRLEKKHKMITQESNNHFTTISIVNWHYYQGNGNTSDNNQITTRQQLDNTKQEVRIKNKEIRTPDYLLSEEGKKYFYGKYQNLTRRKIDEQLEVAIDWLKSTGNTYKDYQAFGRNWLRKTKETPKTEHIPYVPPRNSEFTDIGAELANKLGKL